MGRRTAKSDNPRPSSVSSRDEAARQIREQIDKGIAIRDREMNTVNALENAEAAQSKWHAFNVELLRRLFDNDSEAEAFDMIIPGAYLMGPSLP